MKTFAIIGYTLTAVLLVVLALSVRRIAREFDEFTRGI